LFAYQSSTALTYPVRFNVVFKYFGQLCSVLTFLSIVPLCTSLLFGEPYIALRYAVVACVYLTIGFVLAPKKAPTDLQPNEGMMVVISMFLFTCLITSYPIMGEGMSFINAFFEVVSAITTTALSTVSTVSDAPRSFLFERAWMQWYGTLGFITLSLAILMQPGFTTRMLAESEAEPDNLAVGTRAHAKQVVKIICLLTVICFLGAWLLGLGWFDAFLYSLTTPTTGGFAPTDTGIGGLNWQLQLWFTIICLLGAIPLTIYHRFIAKSNFFAIDFLQAKVLLFLCLFFSISIGLCLHMHNHIPFEQLIYKAPMFAIQAQTATGFTTGIACSDLDPGSKLLTICSMVIGGGVGSTSGGIKILRILIILNILKVMFQKVSMPHHAVATHKLAGFRLRNENFISPLLLVVLNVLVILISWFAFLSYGYNPLDSLFETVSAVSSAGLSVGITNASLPVFLKLVLCIDMLFGRLEIFAWLLMLCPWTWLGKRRRGA
jgi:trk system potassium uptake protein TrkH